MFWYNKKKSRLLWKRDILFILSNVVLFLFLCTQRPASLQLAKVKVKIIAVKESISCVHFLSFCFKSAQIYTLFIYCARKR